MGKYKWYHNDYKNFKNYNDNIPESLEPGYKIFKSKSLRLKKLNSRYENKIKKLIEKTELKLKEKIKKIEEDLIEEQKKIYTDF